MSTPNPSPHLHPLNYSPRQPHPRPWLRQLTRWSLLVTVALLILGTAGLAIYQCNVLYWQRQCLNHVNTGQVVNLDAPNVTGPPAEWTRLGGGDAVSATENCLYLGHMNRPDGVERLVYVFESRFYNLGRRVQIGGTVERLATIFEPPAQVATVHDMRARDAFATSDNETPTPHYPIIHGAILDPTDPSHFTFQVQAIDGTTHTIDGFLDNSDTLHIEDRSQP